MSGGELGFLRLLIAVFVPPVLGLVTLGFAMTRKPKNKSKVMAASVSSVAAVGAESLGFLLEPSHSLVAAGLFLVIVLLLRRAVSDGSFGVAAAGATGVMVLVFGVAWSLYLKAPSQMALAAIFFGMIASCAVTAYVLLGATFAFLSTASREEEPVPLIGYVGATVSCVAWYLLGVFMHWACTGPSVNVVAG